MSYRTDTRALVLAALKDGPKHGYAIGKSIREGSGDLLKLGEGQLYPLLHELEEKGFVSGEWEGVPGDPPRRVYTLTSTGEGELLRRAKKWADFAGAVGSLLSTSKLETSHE